MNPFPILPFKAFIISIGNKSGSKFGLIIFSDHVQRIIPAGGGRGHYDIIRDVLYDYVATTNPLDAITNTRRIAQVYLRGTPVDRARIRARWTGTGATR